MDEHVRDDFYSISELSLEKIKELFLEASEKSYKIETQILDLNKSWSRQHVDMSMEEMLSKHNNAAHNVFIHRKGYHPKDQNDPDDIWRWKLEIGFSTMDKPSYYLFIHVDQQHLDFFIEKYKLKKK